MSNKKISQLTEATSVTANDLIPVVTDVATTPVTKKTLLSTLKTFINALEKTGGTLVGNLLFTDNTYDIGATGANRPKSIYAGTSITAPTITGTTFNKVAITSPATGATLTIADGKTLSVPVAGANSAVINVATGTAINSSSSFGGYTLQQLAQALFDAGILPIGWILKDDYTDTVSAGSVNGTSAVPTGGIRTVTDTNSKISVGSGVLDFAVGSAVSDGVWYPIITRQAGITLFAKLAIANTAGVEVVGWDSNTSSNPNDAFYFSTTTGIRILPNAGGQITVGDYTATTYTVALVMRTAGTLFFVKGGVYTNWTLLYATTVYNANSYPVVEARGASSVFTNEFTRIPAIAISITPIASDSFNRTNGAIGSTDGAGSLESGGSGLAWTNQVGTFAISSNTAVASATSGSVAIATVTTSPADVLIESAVTRSVGSAGIVLRYTDSSNYIYAVHNGTNAKLVKIVSGTPTTLIDTAVTYVAGARLIVSANGTKFRLYYNDTLVGTEQTVSDSALATGNTGIYSTNTTDAVDNFAVWAKGNNSEYSIFDTYVA